MQVLPIYLEVCVCTVSLNRVLHFQSHSSGERSGLTAIRNAAAVLSNITDYGIAWIFLGIRERAEGDQQIGPDDATAFRNIVAVSLSIDFLLSCQSYESYKIFI